MQRLLSFHSAVLNRNMKISPWPWNLAFLECTCFWPGRWTLLIELGNWTHKQFSGWISPHPRLQERKQRKNNSWKTQLWHRSMGRPRKALSSSTSAGKSQRKMKVPGAGGKEKASQGAAQTRSAAEFARAASLLLWQLWWQDTAFWDLLCILQGGWLVPVPQSGCENLEVSQIFKNSWQHPGFSPSHVCQQNLVHTVWFFLPLWWFRKEIRLLFIT